MSDRLLGAACLVLAAFYIYAATLVQVSFISDPVGPKVFPIIIGIVLAVAGLYPLLRPDPEPQWPHLGGLLEIVFAAGVMVAYTYALPSFGFVASTAVAASLLSWRLDARPQWALAAGLGISLGIYVIFHLVLGLSLARGPWGF